MTRIFRLLGKGPEAVVVTFCTGDPDLCRRMAEEIRGLVPDRRHFVATPENWPQVRAAIKPYRIGLAPVMLTRQPSALRRAAYRLAPHKILAYNSRLERHHLRLDLASLLFWRGVPLDRIYLRPRWWPWPRRERSLIPQGYRVLEGRSCSPARRRVAVLSPYFPYPLSHGGAVRIYNLLREIAQEFDVELFTFTVGDAQPETAPVLEFCARVVLVGKPRYREPRWSTLLPPEVHEFRSPAMRQALAEERRAFGFELCRWSTRNWRRTAATVAISWWSTTSPSICSARSPNANAPYRPAGTPCAGVVSKRGNCAASGGWW